MSCNPEGDVCHYQNYGNTCGNSSARNDCCGGVGNSGVCQLDPLGVPRCFGLGTSCQMTGDTCAFSGDCCDGAPCVPDDNGVLRCGGTQCVPTRRLVLERPPTAATARPAPSRPARSRARAAAATPAPSSARTARTPTRAAPASPATSPAATRSMTCPAGQSTGCVCQVVVHLTRAAAVSPSGWSGRGASRRACRRRRRRGS